MKSASSFLEGSRNSVSGQTSGRPPADWNAVSKPAPRGSPEAPRHGPRVDLAVHEERFLLRNVGTEDHDHELVRRLTRIRAGSELCRELAVSNLKGPLALKREDDGLRHRAARIDTGTHQVRSRNEDLLGFGDERERSDVLLSRVDLDARLPVPVLSHDVGRAARRSPVLHHARRFTHIANASRSAQGR